MDALIETVQGLIRTRFGILDRVRRMVGLGFRIDEISANGNYFELVAQELRRVSAIGTRFSQGRLRFYERWALKIVLAGLARLSSHDQGSHDLACFGLHVRATRLSVAATNPVPLAVKPLPRVA